MQELETEALNATSRASTELFGPIGMNGEDNVEAGHVGNHEEKNEGRQPHEAPLSDEGGGGASQCFAALIPPPPGVSTIFEMPVKTHPISSWSKIPSQLLEPLVRDALKLEYPLKDKLK